MAALSRAPVLDHDMIGQEVGLEVGGKAKTHLGRQAAMPQHAAEQHDVVAAAANQALFLRPGSVTQLCSAYRPIASCSEVAVSRAMCVLPPAY